MSEQGRVPGYQAILIELEATFPRLITTSDGTLSHVKGAVGALLHALNRVEIPDDQRESIRNRLRELVELEKEAGLFYASYDIGQVLEGIGGE